MCKFIMMVGIPGSGKSTFAEKVAKSENGIVVSSDSLREELFGNVWELRKNMQLFGEMFKRTYEYLSDGVSVVFDATNIRRSERKRILKRYNSYFKECYYIKTSLEKALRQNMERDRRVPEEIIAGMYRKIQEPDNAEGWNRINIIENN